MPVEIKLSTTLRKYSPGYDPGRGLLLDPGPAGVSAAEIAGELGLPLAEIKFIMLNGRYQPLETIVRDNDRLAFFPAVGGG